jgi:hypothetical protein
MADAMYLLQTGQPLPLVLYGSENKWKAGVVIVAQNHWLFGEIVFEEGSSTSDVFGLPYYQAHLGEETECLAGDVIEISTTIGQLEYPFWTYGIMFPDFIKGNGKGAYQYSLLRSSWQYLDQQYAWNEFSF